VSDEILVLNSGSSSIKFAVFTATAAPMQRLHGIVSGLGARAAFSAFDASGEPLPGALPASDAATPLTHESALAWLFAWLASFGGGGHVLAAGHRVVHGGARFAEPARIDAGIVAQLEKLVPMAPLHQPHDLAAIRALMKLRPELPQVACFDTVFHRTVPALAQTFLELSTGSRFTVVVNHFKSKGSACNDVGDPDMGDGQGNCNGTRTLAAQACGRLHHTCPE